MKEVGNLKCPIEAVERAAEVEVLESFLSEQSIAEDPDCYGSVPPLLIGFVNLKLLLELHSVLN
jgi:hypothetical protein